MIKRNQTQVFISKQKNVKNGVELTCIATIILAQTTAI